MQKVKFTELMLSQEMQRALDDMGFEEASQIQAGAIPVILEGKDVIGQAQTGTGKTAAFGIPLLEMLDEHVNEISSLIMCPTRELSLQVSNELKKLAKYRKHVRILAVYGGESIQNQIKDLKRGIHIVVGTPGRMIDHLERGTIKLDKVKMVVLDEADEMLNMGFREDIETILQRVPATRQTVLFSATMPKVIMDIVHNYQSEPSLIKVTKTELTSANIEQGYFETVNAEKARIMHALIDTQDLKSVVVFCNTKRRVDELVATLQAEGLSAEALHGDLSQAQRNRVMLAFRSAKVKVLVATDVAARGIDVSNLDAVFNYDLPHDPEYYVHRIGRTGRAGNTGKAFSFVTGRNEYRMLREIENYAKIKVDKLEAPSAKERQRLHIDKLFDKAYHSVVHDDLKKYEELVDDFCQEGFHPQQLAAALIKMSLPVIKESKPLREKERTQGRFDKKGKDTGGFRNKKKDFGKGGKKKFGRRY
jgi:ATP-dependent RNA helicase DeaD